MQYVAVDMLVALGKIGAATFLSLFRKILTITLTAVLPLFLGSFAAFYGEPIMDAASGITATILFFIVLKRALHARENSAEEIAV